MGGAPCVSGVLFVVGVHVALQESQEAQHRSGEHSQQVGAENDRELVELLLPQLTEVPYPKQYLEVKKVELLEHGFEILGKREKSDGRFVSLMVGALVWFARMIELGVSGLFC